VRFPGKQVTSAHAAAPPAGRAWRADAEAQRKRLSGLDTGTHSAWDVTFRLFGRAGTALALVFRLAIAPFDHITERLGAARASRQLQLIGT
jgi:hypothetical protein